MGREERALFVNTLVLRSICGMGVDSYSLLFSLSLAVENRGNARDPLPVMLPRAHSTKHTSFWFLLFLELSIHCCTWHA